MKRIILEKISSTNDYMKQGGSWENGDRVITTGQTDGRGRRGRKWLADGGVAFTVFCRSELPLTLPAIAAVAAAEILEEGGISVGIKWPNDIILGGKKLGGILCEMVDDGVLVGIGFNLSQTKEDFEQAGLPYATSFAAEGIPVPDAVRLSDAVCDKIVYLAEGKPWLTTYRQKSVTLGKEVLLIGGDKTEKALAVDITDRGELLVEQEGVRKIVRSGEVSVRGLFGYI